MKESRFTYHRVPLNSADKVDFVFWANRTRTQLIEAAPVVATKRELAPDAARADN